MVTTGAKIKFTYEDYCNAPEDKRYELHDGDLILVPSPKSASPEDFTRTRHLS